MSLPPEVHLLFRLQQSEVMFSFAWLQVVHKERVTLESQLELLRPLASTWLSLKSDRSHLPVLSQGRASVSLLNTNVWAKTQVVVCFFYEHWIKVKGLTMEAKCILTQRTGMLLFLNYQLQLESMCLFALWLKMLCRTKPCVFNHCIICTCTMFSLWLSNLFVLWFTVRFSHKSFMVYRTCLHIFPWLWKINFLSGPSSQISCFSTYHISCISTYTHTIKQAMVLQIAFSFLRCLHWKEK